MSNSLYIGLMDVPQEVSKTQNDTDLSSNSDMGEDCVSRASNKEKEDDMIAQTLVNFLKSI